MPFTLFPSSLKKGYTLNFYRSYSFGKDKNLVTTEHGSWVLLSDDEFRALRAHRVAERPRLFNTLEQVGVILTEDNIHEVTKSYRERFSHLFRGPVLHIMIPTFRCNLRCEYCHSVPKPPNSRGWDMDEETMKSIMDFIVTSPSKVLTAEFQGGECLLNFDLIKSMVEYGRRKAREKNKVIGLRVVTNLTEMDEEKLDFFKENRIVDLCTSLDGPKEVHNKNRKYFSGGGSYDDAVYWMKRINEEYDEYFSLGALCTVTRHSLPYPKEIVDKYYELGFRTIWPRFLNNLGFAKSRWEEIGYTAEEYLKFYKELLDYVLKLNKEGKFMKETYASQIAGSILRSRHPRNVDMTSPCGAGIGQLLYNHEGDIFTCDEAKVLGDEFKLGNVKENTMEEIISHPTVTSMIDISSKFPLVCDNCPFSPYCAVCPVNFYLTQGNIVPKLAGEFRCKIYREIIKTVFRKILFSKKDREIILKWLKIPGIRRKQLIKHKSPRK